MFLCSAIYPFTICLLFSIDAFVFLCIVLFLAVVEKCFGSHVLACYIGYTLDQNLRNCTMVPSSTALIVGLSVTMPLAILLLCILLAVAAWLFFRKKQSVLASLPTEVAASYKVRFAHRFLVLRFLS
jgi:hypothetical protein